MPAEKTVCFGLISPTPDTIIYRQNAGQWEIGPIQIPDWMYIIRAKIKKGKFHDCRSTALSNWLAQGLSEYEVMRLAGHSDFSTTHKFYLAIKNDYLDKARQANVGLGMKLVEWE